MESCLIKAKVVIKMYHCINCGNVFVKPKQVHEEQLTLFGIADFTLENKISVCPLCESAEIEREN